MASALALYRGPNRYFGVPPKILATKQRLRSIRPRRHRRQERESHRQTLGTPLQANGSTFPDAIKISYSLNRSVRRPKSKLIVRLITNFAGDRVDMRHGLRDGRLSGTIGISNILLVSWARERLLRSTRSNSRDNAEHERRF